jgi:ribosomal protein S3AE
LNHKRQKTVKKKKERKKKKKKKERKKEKWKEKKDFSVNPNHLFESSNVNQNG